MTERLGNLPKGTVCLTFDDAFVDHWINAMPLFDEFRCKVTFCVCKLHELNASALKGLTLLQDAGHEIAYHTRSHHNAARFIEKHGLEAWVAKELDQGIADHRAAGFPARSFAPAFHNLPPKAARATAERFDASRGKGPPTNPNRNLERRIYTAPQNLVHCAGWLDIRHPAFPGWRSTNRLLRDTKRLGGTAVFAGHDIRSQATDAGFYLTHDDLGHLLELAQEQGLGFVTLSQMGVPQF